MTDFHAITKQGQVLVMRLEDGVLSFPTPDPMSAPCDGQQAASIPQNRDEVSQGQR
jgi:hypothetical protein